LALPAFLPFGTFAAHTVARVTSSPRQPVLGHTSETLHVPLLTKSFSPRTRMPSTL
jgi:hypothetical protein